jgi:hypothetical protein
MIYFLKHVFSLIKFCKTGTQEGGEGLEGRHVDALNYVRILWTLVEEAKKADEAEWEEVDPTSPDEVYRMTGIDPRDLAEAINRKYANCSCPTCRRCFERDANAAQDWLERVNEKFDNAKENKENCLW